MIVVLAGIAILAAITGYGFRRLRRWAVWTEVLVALCGLLWYFLWFMIPAKPDFYQIFKIDQSLDIMRNATVPMRDRVKEFSYKAGGGKIAPLFDGTERVVSIDTMHWYNRGVYLP